MRIFKCDVCLEPFEYVKGSINNIKFYIEPINITGNPRLAYWNENKLLKPYGGHEMASYHICQKCFDVIRDTLIDLRNARAGNPTSDSQK